MNALDNFPKGATSAAIPFGGERIIRAITPKAFKTARVPDTFMGIPYRVNDRVPSNQVWLLGAGGQILGRIFVDPPEVA